MTRDFCARQGKAFLRRVVQVASDCGDKQGLDIAGDAGTDPGHFSKALHHQGVHFCVGCHLPHVMNRDRERSIVQGFAQFHGGLWVPRPTRTPEEENRAFREWIEEIGGDPERVLARRGG